MSESRGLGGPKVRLARHMATVTEKTTRVVKAQWPFDEGACPLRSVPAGSASDQPERLVACSGAARCL